MKSGPILSAILLCLIATGDSGAAEAAQSSILRRDQRPAALEGSDPFWPSLESPKLLTPQWIGEQGVDAAVILAIDDMRTESLAKYEAFLRPIIGRLKKSRGRAPISIMTNTVKPADPQLQVWLKEGLNFDVHTLRHPCPLLGGLPKPGEPQVASINPFDAAKATVLDCLDLLAQVPGNRPVAFRMPCCDSMSSPSPRFFAEIFPRASAKGNRMVIDSSVMNLITPADTSLPKEIVRDREGRDRFAKYFPGSKTTGPWKQKSLRNFGTYIENHPYPYGINKVCWEFPCVVPSDWEAFNVLDKASPQMLEDWKAALDAIVLKQGVFTMIFHPHGWSTPEQLVAFIDYAEAKYGRRVKFLNFAEAAERIARIDMAPYSKPPTRLPDAPLPELAKQAGARLVDLNADGYDDIVVSNAREYGVFLFNPVEKKNVQWDFGWTHVMREGKAGDAHSIPMITRADGTDNGVWFKHGAMWLQNEDTAALPDKVRRIPFEELLKVPGPAPMPPEESLRALQLKAGFRAELVAHEPLVQDPVFVDWDARGRMWVVEMGDYPFAPGETTKDGKVGQQKVSELQSGRIKILEDTDGDGHYDKATLFLDGLTHPTGLAPWRNGVFVAAIPDIIFAEDTDGDGKCDQREPWFSGFTAGNPQHLVNGFCWGLDGWLYGANGDSGGDITCVKTGKKVALGTNDFRFHPQTGEFEIEAGRTQCGKWRDDWGNWFGNNNSAWGWHYWLPMAHLAQNPALSVRSMRELLNDDKRVFPVSPPLRRFNWAAATNTLTSGCNAMPYRDRVFGGDGRDALFICEPANNLVHREVLDYSKAPITSRRHAHDSESEFLASRDNWCRPVMARTGPDGALYVVDMYRLVLEHPEWIPAEMCRYMDLRAGEDKGRIYRISKTERSDASASFRGRMPFDRAGVRDLVEALRASNGWVRDTAQRLLIEREEREAVASLLALGNDAAVSPESRIQALFTARLLGGIGAGQLVAALRPLYPRVRAAALLATGTTDSSVLPAEELALIQKQGLQRVTKPVAPVPVITSNNPDRQKVVAHYNREVARLKGDATRGQLVFQKACIACHKSHGQGVEVGPDLGTVAAKPDEQLIEAIFDPNRAVELRNAATQVTKKDGGVLLGLLATETPGNIALRLPGGVEMVVQRSDIKEMKTLNTSLMLVGLEGVVSPQDCADLLAWMRAPAPGTKPGR